MIIPVKVRRYEYLWELMGELEQTCETCRFRKSVREFNDHAVDYPMCLEVESEILHEDKPVEVLDEDEHGMVVCTKYRPGDPDETFGAHPDQQELF